MKKFISLMALVAVFMFSGCSQPEVGKFNGKSYNLWEKEKGTYKVSSLGRLNLKEQLNVAALETKKRGFNYFVLLNAGVNNLNGFPINRYSELRRYISLQSRFPSFQTNGKNQKRGNTPLRFGKDRVRVLFKPVGNEYKNSYISVWSVAQTLRDTK